MHRDDWTPPRAPESQVSTPSQQPCKLGSEPPPTPQPTHPGLLQDGLSLGLLRGDHGSFGARVAAPSEPELQM